MTKEEIDKLKICIKEKDRRIKKIEGYFKLRNKLIVSSILSIVCGSPVIWMLSIFTKVLDNQDMLTAEENVIMLVGTITIIIVPVAIWLFLIAEIWDD